MGIIYNQIEIINKQKEIIKKINEIKILESKSTNTKVKDALEGFNNRFK